MKKLFFLSIMSISFLHGMSNPDEERINSLVFQGDKVIALYNKETHMLIPAYQFDQIYYTLILQFTSHEDAPPADSPLYLIDPKYVIVQHASECPKHKYSVEPIHCNNLSDCNATPLKHCWYLKTHALDKTAGINPNPTQEIYHYPLIMRKTVHYASQLLAVALGCYIAWSVKKC